MTPPTFEQVMQLTRTVSGATAFEDAECSAFYNLCCRMTPESNVVEIGCQIGRSSSIIAQVGAAVGFRSIHVDPYVDNLDYLLRWTRMMHDTEHRYTFLHMKTEDSSGILRDLTPTGIDLLLIDWDHSAEGVRSDCKIAGDLVRLGGYLCAHDYGHSSLPDVYEVMNEYAVAPDWDRIGVYGTLGVWQRCG